MAPPADPDEHTREVVAGELAQWVQVCTELAAARYRELVDAGDPESAAAAAQVAHDLAGQIHARGRQWSNDERGRISN